VRKYDVAVIGGGPVGSYTALRLAAMGFDVLVVERRKRYGDSICCTGLVSQECVNEYAIEDSLILRQANSATLFSPGGKAFSVRRVEPQASFVDRAELDTVLAKKARDSGADYVMGGTADDIKIENGGITVEVATQGEGLYLYARAAIIATGFGSSLPGKLGMGKVGDFVVGVQAEAEAASLEEVEVYFGRRVAPGFFAWAAPTSKGKALVGMLSRLQPGLYFRQFAESLVAKGKIAPVNTGVLYRGISLSPPSSTYKHRILVIGDAAGQVKPTTGGGIYYGWLCADIAVDVLQRALSDGDLSAKSLASYERAWKKKIGWELRMGRWARKVYESLSDRQVNLAVDIMKSGGIDRIVQEREDLHFDSHGKVILSLIKYGILSKIGGKPSSSPPRKT
jgi:geranylgeranyl reductase family protein